MNKIVPARILMVLLLIFAGCASHDATTAKAPDAKKTATQDKTTVTVSREGSVPVDAGQLTLGTTPSDPAVLPPFADDDVIRRVYALIRSRHMTTDATDQELYYGAIRGMVQALNDPYSAYLDPKSAKRSREQMAGNFVGIGAQLKMEDNQLTITAAMEDSPALKAGIKAGDVIVAIDGDSTEGMAIDAAVARIRGEAGTSVTLKITRKGLAEPLEFKLVRAKIDTPTVKWKIEQAHGKVLLRVIVNEFGMDTPKLFVDALKAGRKANATGIILDLRNDPGGMVSTAGFITCHWISKQPFAILAYRNKVQEPLMCDDDAPLIGVPTVVLVNKGSASASEITAGALQDLGRARIIGEKTHGKGCGQDITDFPDGSQLRLVSFLWYTPKGRSIHKVGVTPDEIVKNEAADVEKGRDAQLERAKEYLSTGK